MATATSNFLAGLVWIFHQSHNRNDQADIVNLKTVFQYLNCTVHVFPDDDETIENKTILTKRYMKAKMNECK